MNNSQYYSRAYNMAHVTTEVLKALYSNFYLNNPKLSVEEKNAAAKTYAPILEGNSFTDALCDELCSSLDMGFWENEYFDYRHFPLAIVGGEKDEKTELDNALAKFGLSKEKLGLNRDETNDLLIRVRIPEYSHGVFVDAIDYKVKNGPNQYKKTTVSVDEIPVSNTESKWYLQSQQHASIKKGAEEMKGTVSDILKDTFVKDIMTNPHRTVSTSKSNK